MPNMMAEDEKLLYSTHCKNICMMRFFGKILVEEKQDIVYGQTNYSISGYSINDIKYTCMLVAEQYDKKAPNNYKVLE